MFAIDRIDTSIEYTKDVDVNGDIKLISVVTQGGEKVTREKVITEENRLKYLIDFNNQLTGFAGRRIQLDEEEARINLLIQQLTKE